MLAEELCNSKESLQKTKKICRVLNIALRVAFAIFCLYWIISVGSLAYSLFGAESSSSGVGLLQLLLCIAFGLTIGSMFVLFMRIFSDVIKGDSPFTIIQIKRLRVLAGLLLVYFILDTLISNSAILASINGYDYGYVSTGNDSIITVYFTPLIAAAVVFAFSFVFKYGVLLQEFSDETL